MRQISVPESGDLDIPLSLAVEENGFVFVSGNGPDDPETGEIVSDDVTEQAKQTLRNVESVLEAADASLDDVVKTTAYITDADYYDPFNSGYEEVLSEPYPARSCLVTGIVREGQKVEIEAIARAPGDG